MALIKELLKKIGDPRLTRSERALARCVLARELEASGSYEAARGALAELWQGIGERPRITALEPLAQATVLLRSGTLSSCLGGVRQSPLARKNAAQDLIREALGRYVELGEKARAAEARIEMAWWCLRRSGASAEASAMLIDATRDLSAEQEPELCALAVVRRAIVERETGRFAKALELLGEAAPLFDRLAESYALKGSYHHTLALALRGLGQSERREDHIDRALIELAAAGSYFKRTDYTRDHGSSEHNLGQLHLKAGRFTEAREHLDRARRLYESVKDEACVAIVDETRALLLLAEGRNFKAERLARVAVIALARGGERAAELVEALTTHAVSLARLGHHVHAKNVFARAISTGGRIGDSAGAGRAAVTMIEELTDKLSGEELREAYDIADSMLRRGAQQAAIIERLRNCAKLIIHAAQNGVAKMDFAQSCSFVHASAQTTELLFQVERAARTDVTLLITGETGTGKEVLAAQIHVWSGRKGPLIIVNCAGLNENLVESEVFGHRKGAFTDAIQDHDGAAKRAAGGTLFLDEIGELSLVNQAKLLRLLESKEVKALGSDTAERINLRIIAATNQNLSKLVREGRFRLDLYHRLCVFVVEIPPLRERAEDIRPLAEHFIASALKRNGRQMTFSEEALATIAQLELRGNARELRSLIERTVILGSNGGEVTPLAVHNAALQRTSATTTAIDSHIDVSRKRRGCSLANEVKAYEKELIRGALQKSGGSITKAARLLSISHQALAKKINSSHQDLKSARKQPRRRSIFRKET